jgi:osmotically-inducible protein OsmY
VSVSDMVLLVVGGPRRRRSGVLELRARLQDALNEDLFHDGASLTVIANGGMITVRGEVGSLDQISRATRVIDRCRGGTDIVNLVRVRPSAVAARSGALAQ